jgi:Na+/phosphate symporter
VILMWLGPLVLVFAGVEILRRGLSGWLSRFQRPFLQLGTSSAGAVSSLKMLIVTKLCAFSQGSLLQNQYSATALLGARISSQHYALVLLCLSGVGCWTALLCTGLAWQISGFYLLVCSFIIYLWKFWTGRGANLGQAVFGLAIFLLGIEWTLRQQGVLFSVLGESDFHFLLADGRLPAQMIWLVISMVLTTLIGLEFWSLVLSLVLVAAGSLSLNGAIGLMTGELLAHLLLLVWRSRGLNAETKSLVKGYAMSSGLGLVVGFFVAGYLRDIFAWSLTFDASQLIEKNLQLGLLFVSLILSKTIAAMIWGHFAAKAGMDQAQREVQVGQYFSPRWVERGWISQAVLTFLRERLMLRLVELRAQALQMDEARGSIPAQLLKVHQSETVQLSEWLRQTDKSREMF